MSSLFSLLHPAPQVGVAAVTEVVPFSGRPLKGKSRLGEVEGSLAVAASKVPGLGDHLRLEKRVDSRDGTEYWSVDAMAWHVFKTTFFLSRFASDAPEV